MRRPSASAPTTATGWSCWGRLPWKSFETKSFCGPINVDGYLFSAGALDPVIAHNLRINGIPFVSVNQIDDPTTVNLVEHDHQRDHALVYQHLYDLGHRRIGEIILANPVEFWNAQFEKFYREFMKKHNIYNTNYYVGYTERPAICSGVTATGGNRSSLKNT